MPIIDARYISDWWYLTSAEGVSYLLESFTETQVQSLQKKELLQGDIGTKVMTVAGQKWNTSIKSPVIIIQDVGLANDRLTNVFDLLLESYNAARSRFVPTNINYVLKKAIIDINENGVTCTLEYVSSVPGAFSPKRFGVASFDLGPPENIIGRTTRNFDCVFYTGELLAITNSTPFVRNGKIEIDFNIKEHYFVNTTNFNYSGQYPYYSVQGYKITGHVEVAVTPDCFDQVYIGHQKPGFLNASADTGILAIASGNNAPAVLNFGSLRMHSSLEKALNPGDTATMKFDFESFTGEGV